MDNLVLVHLRFQVHLKAVSYDYMLQSKCLIDDYAKDGGTGEI